MAVAVGLAVVAVLVVAGGLLSPLRGLVVSGVLLAATAVVFALVITDESLSEADLPVLSWLVGHRSPGWTATAETLSLVGGTVGTGGLAVLAAAVLAWRGQRTAAVIWVVGVVVGSITIRVLKIAIERPRPPIATRLGVETTASLPSGHSLMAALGLGLVVCAVWRLVAAPAVRAIVLVVAIAAAAAIGASRAYLGVHWTTDVLAGWLLGTAIAVACVAVTRWCDHRDDSGGAARPAAAAARR